MSEQHPITPPPEFGQQLWQTLRDQTQELGAEEAWDRVITSAYRAGADQELEACCEWLDIPNNRRDGWLMPGRLRAARRPKPPSLKEQALSALCAITSGADDTREFYQDIETIKTALEALPDD